MNTHESQQYLVFGISLCPNVCRAFHAAGQIGNQAKQISKARSFGLVEINRLDRYTSGKRASRIIVDNAMHGYVTTNGCLNLVENVIGKTTCDTGRTRSRIYVEHHFVVNVQRLDATGYAADGLDFPLSRPRLAKQCVGIESMFAVSRELNCSTPRLSGFWMSMKDCCVRALKDISAILDSLSARNPRSKLVATSLAVECRSSFDSGSIVTTALPSSKPTRR